MFRPGWVFKTAALLPAVVGAACVRTDLPREHPRRGATSDASQSTRSLPNLVSAREQAQADSPNPVKLVERDASGEVTGIWLQTHTATDHDVRLISQLHELVKVKIRCARISAEPLAALADLSHLDHLQLSGMFLPVSWEYLKAFTNTHSLRVLTIDESVIENNALAHLRQLGQLHELDLRADALTDDSIRLIGLLSVETLDLSRNRELTDRVLVEVGAWPNLKRLIVADCNISKRAIQRFRNISRIAISDAAD